jgi:hypothetical protein
MGNQILHFAKPEFREAGQDTALVRDTIGENYIKCRNPVCSDNKKILTQVIDVPDLASPDRSKPFYICLKEYLLCHKLNPSSGYSCKGRLRVKT